jgi:hypothetical protein
LEDAGLQTQPVGLSTSFHVALKALDVGTPANTLVDVIVLDPSDVNPQHAGVHLGRWMYAREQGLRLTDQVFINTQQYPARAGTVTPEQAFKQIPHHEAIKTCAAG